MKATFSRPLWTTWTNCVRVCSISVVLSFCSLVPSLARGDQASDVAAILGLLQSIYTGEDAIYTIPYNDYGNLPLDVVMGNGLYRHYVPGSLPGTGDSYLYQIERELYSLILPLLRDISVNSSNMVNRAPVDSLLTNAFSRILGSLNQLEYMGQNVTAWESYWTNELVPMHAIMDAVRSTEYTNAWNVALVGDQWSDIRDYLQGLTGSTADSSDYLQGLTISADTNTTLQTSIAGDLDALRRGLLTDTDSLSVVEEHVDDVEGYVDEDIETNALAALTISPGDAGDLSPVLDLVDPDAFDVLPSLTGGDPVVQVFTASRDSNLPAFSIDFSLPSGFRTFIHAVCVWLWRMLFFLAMWRLVNEEYGYWSTLGGSAG